MPDPTGVGGTREQIMAAYREVRERLKARLSSRFLAPEAEKPG
jgi:protein-tyrosine-phosphatase